MSYFLAHFIVLQTILFQFSGLKFITQTRDCAPLVDWKSNFIGLYTEEALR